MKKNLLYNHLAKYYDTIYADKDYKKECDWITKLIAENKTSGGNKLLDITCGTGEHLSYLKNKFSCTGSDLNNEMIKIAINKYPDITFKVKNMLDKIDDKYDIIISMFSSIAYLETYENFALFIKNINESLIPGGIILIQPWFEKDKFTPGVAYPKIYDDNFIRMAIGRVEGLCSIVEYHYLINVNNKIKYIVDNHKMALYDINRLMEIMETENIKTKFIAPHIDNGRGIIIGIKQGV